MAATAELIRQSVLPEDIEAAHDTSNALKQAEYKVDSPAAYTNAGEILADVKMRRKRLETARDKILAPLKESVDEVKAFFNPPIDEFKTITLAITAAMTRFELAERDRAENHLLLVVAGESQDTAALEVAVPAVAGMSSRVAYDVEIVDASKLPAQYLIPDTVAVRKAALAGVLTEAHGVKLIEKRIITNRGR